MDDGTYHSISTALDAITLQPVTTEAILMLLLLTVMLVLSALISSSEPALFSLSALQIEKIRAGEDVKSKRLTALLEQPDRVLATILIGNNFVDVGIVMLSAFAMPMFIDFGDQHVLQFVFESVIITLIILFFGEVLPKIYASEQNYKVAMFMTTPLTVLNYVFYPFSSLLMNSTSFVNERMAKHRKNMSIDDLQEAIELTKTDIKDEQDILDGIVKFSGLTAADIMTPRLDVVNVDLADKFEEVLQTVVESGYSRIPVYNGRPDDVKGILYVKDLLPHIDEKDFAWQKIIREPYFVPENKKINDLLEEFQSHNTHLAVVVDEYGGVLGVVTLEDIIEEIVGDINDELDEDEHLWTRDQQGNYIFEAKISLNDFCKITEIDEDVFEKVRGDAETLAGLLLEINGLIPQKGDVIKHDGYEFRIEEADARKINKVMFMMPQTDGSTN